MTSQLNVDTIVDKAGSGGTNVKVANTSTYVSDGGATTQNTVQGLAKAWVNFNHTTIDSGTDLDGVRKSFNIASVVDVDTGRANTNFTNPMADAGHISTGSAGDATQGNARNIFIDDGVANTASTIASNVENNSSTPVDAEYVAIVTHGDLA